MWLYPFPLVLALIGWAFVFITSGKQIIAFGFAILILGLLAFAIWRRWPHRMHTHPICDICDYDLTGNTSGVCPECGTPVECLHSSGP
jgi:hypothetical protein